MTHTKKGIRMIRYSTQPSADAKVILNESPTSAIVTTNDDMGLNDTNDQVEDKSNLQDLDAQDQNDD